MDVSKNIVNVSNKDGFVDEVKKITKKTDERFACTEKNGDFVFNLLFSYKDKVDDTVILRCDYSVERVADSVSLINIEDIKNIHKEKNKKNAVFYYLNIKDFNSINQRYSQECGDYILSVVKSRLSKIDKKNMYLSYMGADQFAIYYNRNINKKKALKVIKNINRKLTTPIDIGFVNVDLVFGIGVCLGKYDNLAEFIKGAYVASDYAKKRKKYNIVIYNEGMKLEENIISVCEEELSHILETKEVDIIYNPVFYHSKSKFVGYIGNASFQDKLIDFEKVKSVAVQKDKIDQFMSTILNNQIINNIKKRPNKSSKLFLKLKLEDLSTFLEVYLSNESYSDCKIIICLDVRKGYEMINKFSNISSNISKIIDEGIEFALEINYGNMYDYDYILKNSKYLILDNAIVGNMNNMLVKNKAINIVELANNYNLEMFAIDVKEYIQFETLLNYGVHYFSGPYFGKSANRPNEIEQSKTRIFAKFMKDSKNSKKN